MIFFLFVFTIATELERARKDATKLEEISKKQKQGDYTEQNCSIPCYGLWGCVHGLIAIPVLYATAALSHDSHSGAFKDGTTILSSSILDYFVVV